MKTITTTFNVYTFEELNKVAQDKVKENIKARICGFRCMEIEEDLDEEDLETLLLEDITEEEIMDEITYIEKELGFYFYSDGTYYYGGN